MSIRSGEIVRRGNSFTWHCWFCLLVACMHPSPIRKTSECAYISRFAFRKMIIEWKDRNSTGRDGNISMDLPLANNWNSADNFFTNSTIIDRFAREDLEISNFEYINSFSFHVSHDNWQNKAYNILVSFRIQFFYILLAGRFSLCPSGISFSLISNLAINDRYSSLIGKFRRQGIKDNE